MDLSALKDLTTKLALLACAPGVDVSMSGEYDKVVVSRNDRRELLGIVRLRFDVKDRNGKELMLLAIREAEQTFNGLEEC